MKNGRTCFYLVGLTGSMASGKSTALAGLAKRGAFVLSADELVRELYQTAPVRKQVEKWFGTADPAQLAQAVFSSEKNRVKLEKFLHPLVWKLVQQKVAACSKPWAVLEAPLLLEAGWEEKMDLTVLISAPDKTLPARLKARGISLDEYQRRRNQQLSEAEKISRADIVIYNDTTPRALDEKIGRLYQALENLYAK